MKDIVIIGAGKIGTAIATMLVASGDYRVTITDRSETQLAKVDKHLQVETQVVDVSDHAGLVEVLKGKFAVLSAAPYDLTVRVAEAALEAGVHYFDLTEDVASTKRVEELANGAKTAFMPQSGLAPGFISIAANDLAKKFDKLDVVRMRVGALPQYPSNALNYNITWSVEGLINEYIEPCEAIVEGKLISVPALEECEEFSLDGVRYEAFNTSRGLGTLANSLEGKVRTMNYRSIRYPGHQTLMKALMSDLNLKNRRDVLIDIFENALPATMQDVVVIFVTVSGWRDGKYVQESYANKVYAAEVAGKSMSAIQIVTSAGVSAVLDLLANGKLRDHGFVRQEEVDFTDFLNNRFGQYYNQTPAKLQKAS